MFGSWTTARDTARRAVEELVAALDVSAMTGEEAVRSLAETGAIRSMVDGVCAKLAKRVADTGADRERGERSAAVLVARTLGMPVGEARSAIDTAARLEDLPATAEAVREGRLSSAQARLVAEAAAANPAAEARLLAAAGQGLVPLRDACVAARAAIEDPGDRAARQRSLRELRTWTDTDGMLAGRFRLTPEIGGQVKAALDAQVQRIFRGRRAGTRHEANEAYAADALARFVLGDGSSGKRAKRARDEGVLAKGVLATVHVVIDHGALVRGGAVDGEVCEIPGVGPVDVAWVRELLGSAFLTFVVKKGKDITTVAHLGRHVPAEVQTALLVSGRECDVEGCHNRGYLERDHVHDHAKGGPTAFHNLCWLCYRHHRMKSSGWQLGATDPATRKRKLRPPPIRAA